MMEYFNARILVISWIVGFVGAGLALSVNQKRTSDQSCWGWSPWQNEIAIWNLGANVMLLGVLASKEDVEPALLLGLFVLVARVFDQPHRGASSQQRPSLSDERRSRGGERGRRVGHSDPLHRHDDETRRSSGRSSLAAEIETPTLDGEVEQPCYPRGRERCSVGVLPVHLLKALWKAVGSSYPTR